MFINIEEAANLLGVCKQSVRRYIHAAKIDMYPPIGRSGFRIKKEDIEKFIEEKNKPIVKSSSL